MIYHRLAMLILAVFLSGCSHYSLSSDNHSFTFPGSAGDLYQKALYIAHQPDTTGNNQRQAVALYEQAARMGSSHAADALASCYEHGIGVKKNTHIASQWYEHAARQGKRPKPLIGLKNQLNRAIP